MTSHDNPATPLDGDELRALYRRRFDDDVTYRRGVWRVLVDDAFQTRLGEAETVLEIGCGWGEFIDQVSARRRIAMDLNPDGASRVGPDVEFLLHSCAAPWPVEPESIDAVFTSNVLEHLADKAAVQQALTHAYAALRPGGRLVCLGPNIRCVPGAYWDFFDHYVPLTERSLVEACELVGFEPVEVIDRFLPYTMVGGRQVPSAFVRLYLRMPLAWRVLGKQFLVTVRKPLP